jgi:hypothetical protein
MKVAQTARRHQREVKVAQVVHRQPGDMMAAQVGLRHPREVKVAPKMNHMEEGKAKAQVCHQWQMTAAPMVGKRPEEPAAMPLGIKGQALVAPVATMDLKISIPGPPI